MKRTLAALLVIAGCGGPSRQAPPDDVQFEKILAQQMTFDFAQLKVGDWALYKGAVRGERNSQTFRWAVVAEEGSTIWIENRVPHAPRGMVVKSRFDRAGNLLAQWVGEPGGGPAQTYPKPDGSEPPVRRDSSLARAATKETLEELVIGERKWLCTKIQTTLTYPDGRRSTMTNWCSKDVPFPLRIGKKTYGGLVRREIGRFTLDLIAAGNRPPTPELTIPR